MGARSVRSRPGTRWVLGTLMATSLASSPGTFASFDASTTNGSALETGMLALATEVNSGTACLSTGTDATNNVSTDTNANAACAAVFTLPVAKPGDTATASLAVMNDGNVDAESGVVFYADGACVDSDTAETYHGSGSPCGTVQTYVQQTDAFGTATSCLYGKGASGVINSTARTFPITVNNGNHTMTLTVDGVAHTLDVTNGSYSRTGFAAAMNAVFGAWATVGVGPDNKIYITSNSVGPTSTISATVSNAFGFQSAGTGTGGQVSCTYDGVHTLAHLTAVHGTLVDGFDLGPLAASDSRYLELGVQAPSATGNDLQGRQATFGYTFTATQ